MMTILGYLTIGFFLITCLLHVYWAVGEKRNSPSIIPTHNGQLSFNPTPAVTLLVALGLFISALIVVGTLGYWRFGLPGWLFKLGIWGLATIFLSRAIGDLHWVGFFKSIRNTPFAYNDTWFYSPLCVGIAIACATLGAFS